MATRLYQFPISHYCEKARWALDYKGIAFETQTLLPGLHVKKLKSLVPESSVPVLQVQDAFIQGSDQIIDYLDTQYPDKLLTPTDTTQKQQSLEWERFAAAKIADPLRNLYYHYLLERPKTLLPLFSADGPWYGSLVLKVIYKRLERRMRAAYQINQRTAQIAMRVVDKAIKQLETHLAQQPFLVGDSFSRADLSMCALLSPLVLPERGYLKLESLSAQPLRDFRMVHITSPVFRWVNTLYNTYR
jgi:glutathione S-transferase